VYLAGINFTYESFSYGEPLLLTIIPESANPDGGDMVIMGRNFGTATEPHQVMIGGTSCADIKVVYNYQLVTCKYPQGEENGLSSIK